jgi:hypothetical protein
MPDLAAVRRAALLLATAQMLTEGEALLRRVADQRQRTAALIGPDTGVFPATTRPRK